MAEQLSLFGSPEPEETPAKPEFAPEPVAAYASVVLDIPTRALSEPFAYGIPRPLANEAQIGSTVLVHFGNRAAAGYLVDIRLSWVTCKASTPSTQPALKPSRLSSANRSLPPRLPVSHAG